MLTPISKAADFLCIAGAAYFSQSVVFRDQSAFSHIDGLMGLLGLTLPFISFRFVKVYKPFRNASMIGGAVRALLAWLVAQFVLAVLSQAYPGSELRAHWLLWWTAIGSCALVVERCVLHSLPSLTRSWRFAPTRIAIVARSASSGDLLARITSQTRNAFSPEVIFDPTLTHDTTIDSIPATCNLDSLQHIVRTRKLREVWIVNAPFEAISVENLLEKFHDEFVNIRVLPMPKENSSDTLVGDYRGVPVLNVMATPERGWDILPKEIFDRVFSACILLAISPILLFIAIAVKLSSPGPVVFRQYRKGVNGKVFSIYKFRTMFEGADKPGSVAQARKGDNRVTKIGRILRRTSLDELPQFFNVLKGDMSVVGPRPHAVEHDEYYKNLVQHYMFRYRIKPGITGWAQVNGYRGETAEIEKMEARVRFDMYYIQHWTFWMDMRIIALTMLKGFSGHSAY